MNDLPCVSQKPIKIARDATSISRFFVFDFWPIKSPSAAFEPVENLVLMYFLLEEGCGHPSREIFSNLAQIAIASCQAKLSQAIGSK